jgi:hypothetical protein
MGKLPITPFFGNSRSALIDYLSAKPTIASCLGANCRSLTTTVSSTNVLNRCASSTAVF